MRAAAIFAAAVLLVSTTAFAQVEAPPVQAMPDVTESQATTEAPATEQTPADGAFVQQAQETDDPVICRTAASTGTRLSRRTTRVCRTRSEWESMQDRNAASMRQAGQTAYARE